MKVKDLKKVIADYEFEKVSATNIHGYRVMKNNKVTENAKVKQVTYDPHGQNIVIIINK